MTKKLLSLLALLAMGMSATGCVVAAAAGAGALVADELNEDDGEFDPLEKAYDDDDSTDPLDKD